MVAVRFCSFVLLFFRQPAHNILSVNTGKLVKQEIPTFKIVLVGKLSISLLFCV